MAGLVCCPWQPGTGRGQVDEGLLAVSVAQTPGKASACRAEVAQNGRKVAQKQQSDSKKSGSDSRAALNRPPRRAKRLKVFVKRRTFRSAAAQQASMSSFPPAARGSRGLEGVRWMKGLAVSVAQNPGEASASRIKAAQSGSEVAQKQRSGSKKSESDARAALNRPPGRGKRLKRLVKRRAFGSAAAQTSMSSFPPAARGSRGKRREFDTPQAWRFPLCAGKRKRLSFLCTRHSDERILVRMRANAPSIHVGPSRWCCPARLSNAARCRAGSGTSVSSCCCSAGEKQMLRCGEGTTTSRQGWRYTSTYLFTRVARQGPFGGLLPRGDRLSPQGVELFRAGVKLCLSSRQGFRQRTDV